MAKSRGRGSGEEAEREGGARNENGRIEFPICDMRPRAARAVEGREGREGEERRRFRLCAMVTHGDGHGGRESAGRGLGYHFSAVLPRKHVPGINELTISEQLLPHRERPRRPFSTDLWWWVRPKRRSDVREKAKRRGTLVETKLSFAKRQESPDISGYRANTSIHVVVSLNSSDRTRSVEVDVLDVIAHMTRRYCVYIVLILFSLL